MTALCLDADRVYSANIQRMHGLALIPGHAFFDGETWKKYCDEAMKEIGTTDEDHPEVGILASRLLKEGVKHDPIAESKRRFFMATENAAVMWARNDVMHPALHGLLQGLIVQTMSAFEVLAEDLCRNTMKTGINSVAIPTEKEWRKNQLGFTSRKKIRDTYAFVFSTDNDKIKSVLASTSIDAIALIRNVLIHKDGVIDKVFMDGSKSVPQLSHFRSLGKDADVLITGTWVRALVDPVIPMGYELLNTVDDWLFAHP